MCARCYGMDLSRGRRPAERGLAVGHHRRPVDRRAGHPADHAYLPHRRHGQPRDRGVEVKAKRAGKVSFINLKVVTNAAGANVVLNRNGEVRLSTTAAARSTATQFPVGAAVFVAEDGSTKVKAGSVLCQLGPAPRADPGRVQGQGSLRGPGRGQDPQDRARRSTRHRPQAGHRAQGRPAPAARARGQGPARPWRSTRSPNAPTSRSRTASRSVRVSCRGQDRA